MEIFYRIDREIYDEEMKTFGENPPDDYAFGGDTFSPKDYKWRSGVHRISEKQYDNRTQLDDQAPRGKGKLWFYKENGMYFVSNSTEEKAREAFKRHFKTRFADK